MTAPAPALAPLGHELLDDPAADPRLVRLSLTNIVRSNRLFGGLAAVRFGLSRLLRGVPPGASLTLLDIGTGAGDLAAGARAWAVRRGIALAPMGLDRNPVAARMASQAGVPSVVGCLGSLPLPARSVDLVLMSQVAHHLAPRSVVQLVRDATGLARIGVILADLRRSRVAAAAFGAAATMLRFDEATRHDGIVSVHRGYCTDDLTRLLADAGVRARVYRRPGSRLVATWPAA